MQKQLIRNLIFMQKQLELLLYFMYNTIIL